MSSTLISRVEQVVSRLPKHEIAIGYGSRIMPQTDNSASSPGLVDLLIIAEDESVFVEDMRKRGLISMFSSAFTKKVPHEIAFFADIGVGGIQMKFGVASAPRFFDRLNNWNNSFYIPGRLQKPVQIIHQETDVRALLAHSLRSNRQHALVAGLLALPDEVRARGFSDLKLYETIVGLSYLGDIRMGLAEDPNKVSNIVSAQLSEFQTLYEPFFLHGGVTGSTDFMQCSKTSAELFSMLPDAFKRSTIPLADPRQSLIATLTSINRRESLQHAFVGLGTTGPTKCVKYLTRKIGKRFH